MKPLQLSIFFLLLIYCASSQADPIVSDDSIEPAYYWREYTHDVPRDAFPGGRDTRGKPTYIGQTLHNACGTGMIVTGQVYEAEKKMTYEWGYEEHTTNKNVKILCTRHPERFEWIKTNITNVKNLTDKVLVSGGIEKDCALYIGRVFADDQVAVGRIVVTNSSKVEGLYTTMAGKYLHVLSSFDVLAYKAKDNPTASKLRSPNSSSTSTLWYPLAALIFLRAVYFS